MINTENYQQRREDLINRLKESLSSAKEETDKIPQMSLKLKYTGIIIILALFVNIFLFFGDNSEYMQYWVISAFIFLMVNPFIMMIPTERKGALLSKKSDKIVVKNLLLELKVDLTGGIRAVNSEKKVLSEMAWNLFFINCHPLAPGFFMLFFMNIFFVVLGYFMGSFEYNSALIIGIQSFAIIVFYSGIMMVKPYSSGFFSGILGIRMKVREKYSSGLVSVLKYVLIIAVLAALTGTLLVFALILPGMTLGRFMTIEDVVKFRFLLFAVIFVSQVIFVRYLQGRYSRELVNGFLSYKTEILGEGLLKEAENLPESYDGPVDEENESYEKRLDELEKASVKVMLLKTDYHHFFGYFPVFLIVPNTDFILEMAKKYGRI
ncbi:hypothetical protein F1737_00330 [Methanoplanus sp. FWC-SCC4]|uniref:Uncharacterized protein n=1 Tax=Methanochimaera problematica TaxID=2609417 RepID=A0AA97FD19_9EURY|nr:hypothetical protein [Methanoplanus sp. FWC-SCC4]WOF15231.1 hypothetical protein F1737_00330 [Methanoplanus sp. FWC-SCC4]